MKYARLTPGEGFSPVHGLLYYTQRMVVPRGLRAACVGLLRRWVRVRQGRTAALSPAARAALGLLRRDGYAGLGNLLSPAQCAEVRAHMADKVMANRHDPVQRFTVARVPPLTRIADFALDDILGCPHILELCNSPLLLELAGAYIGCKPTISQLGMRWSFPCAAGESNLQEFHRDSEDWHYFKVLVYLTGVGPADGPHVFARGSHLERASLRLRRFADAEVRARYGERNLIAATGPGGFAFAVDTAGIHKGQGPTGGPRLMLQIQYSLCPSYAYRYEPMPYAGALAFDPYINRLLIRPA
ncbi:MAG TPA: phytanoyl-CoA dioxygenase family protein [Telluria sp.]|nr:phytanoyl-CoA dioxygenase family protein [Telluria sp.]